MDMIDRFLTWLNSRNFVAVRTAVLATTVVMTWKATQWAFLFAEKWLTTTHTGTDTAAVIAAVTLPLAALQTFAFKFYMDAKNV